MLGASSCTPRVTATMFSPVVPARGGVLCWLMLLVVWGQIGRMGYRQSNSEKLVHYSFARVSLSTNLAF